MARTGRPLGRPPGTTPAPPDARTAALREEIAREVLAEVFGGLPGLVSVQLRQELIPQDTLLSLVGTGDLLRELQRRRGRTKGHE
jgi:hypothetical protein